jgi:hypothetical protein
MMGEYGRVGREVNCLRVALEGLEGGRDILGSPDFGRCHSTKPSERAGT